MASITIRNLDDGLKRRLRVRAAENGRSMEEEARDIPAAHRRRGAAPEGSGPRHPRALRDTRRRRARASRARPDAPAAPNSDERAAMIVIDMNVVSELMRQTPAVMAWFTAQDSAELYLTAVSEAVLRAGVAILPAGRRRERPRRRGRRRGRAGLRRTGAALRQRRRQDLRGHCRFTPLRGAADPGGGLSDRRHRPRQRRRDGDPQWHGLRALRNCGHRPVGGRPGVALTPPARRRLRRGRSPQTPRPDRAFHTTACSGLATGLNLCRLIRQSFHSGGRQQWVHVEQETGLGQLGEHALLGLCPRGGLAGEVEVARLAASGPRRSRPVRG